MDEAIRQAYLKRVSQEKPALDTTISTLTMLNPLQKLGLLGGSVMSGVNQFINRSEQGDQPVDALKNAVTSSATGLALGKAISQAPALANLAKKSLTDKLVKVGTSGLSGKTKILPGIGEVPVERINQSKKFIKQMTGFGEQKLRKHQDLMNQQVQMAYNAIEKDPLGQKNKMLTDRLKEVLLRRDEIEKALDKVLFD